MYNLNVARTLIPLRPMKIVVCLSDCTDADILLIVQSYSYR